MKTTLIRQEDVKRQWYHVNATGLTLGRLAVRIARALRGKMKTAFTPNVDMGDFVIVTNAAKVRLSGKKEELKIYKRYSGYRDGLKELPASVVRARHPERLIILAVKNMLPKNKLRQNYLRRLKVYGGSDHPHAAQKPMALP